MILVNSVYYMSNLYNSQVVKSHRNNIGSGHIHDATVISRDKNQTQKKANKREKGYMLL